MFRDSELMKLHQDMKTKPWLGRMEPFRIIGNTYFCGTFQASCHIVDTGEGLILIDPGYANALYLIVDSIYRLGFKPEDVKYIVNTHWHGDHTEATAQLAALTGATTIIARDDVERAAKYFVPDVIIDDGFELRLGDTVMTFLLTPGHTKGTVSLFWDTEEDGVSYRLGMFGGAGVNTMAKGKLDFPEGREAYRASLNRLRGERVDVMIGNHTWNNDTYGKGIRLLAGGENEFIDGALFAKFLDSCEARLDAVIAKDDE